MEDRPIIVQTDNNITLTPIEGVSVEKKYKVFLAWVTPEIESFRDNLAYMLEKAGFDVFPKVAQPTIESDFVEEVAKAMDQCESSIHMLGAEFGRTIKGDPYTSLAKYQFENASIMSQRSQGAFKRFVWNYPHGLASQDIQLEFINTIQNNITEDILFSDFSSSAQLVEEVRKYLTSKKEETQVEKKEYDISFIFNVQDAADCYVTVEKLGELNKIKTLTVVPESDIDYKIEAVTQIRKSNLCVIYFKEASDWAMAFVKQIWKQIGGASAQTPILLIGEDEPRRNRFIRFKAPNVLLSIVKTEDVLDKILESYIKVGHSGKLVEEKFCPYTGLRPFNENESIFFKGRDTHIDTILQMLSTNRYAMVTGSSGDGKSSLIYAGVVPNAKAGFIKATFSKWLVADFKPERQPLRNLSLALSNVLKLKNVDQVEQALGYGFSALVDLYKKSEAYCDMTSKEWADANEDERRTLKRQAANLIILVDQFEEFFTNIENYKDGVASPLSQITINVILETIRIAREEGLPIYVVFTMRSDYIGQCVAFRGFAELIGNSTYFVPRLKREEIQEVIQAPAILNGDRISLRLTQRILNDLGDGTDQLPVLQHALHQMWTYAAKNGEEIDLIHYAKVGGLSPAKLPKSEIENFNKWFATLTPEQKRLIENPKLRNILSRHANELHETAHDYYNANNTEKISKEDAQQIIKTTFICLTKIDENRAVRNRMTLRELTSVLGKPEFTFETITKVVNLFREPGNTFIQPFIHQDDEGSKELYPDSILDITHESLIRNWELLIEWADGENKSVNVFKELKLQVDQWLENDRSPQYLLTSGLYTYFSGWWDLAKPNAPWIHRYLDPDELSPIMDTMEQAEIYHEDIEEYLYLSKQKIDRNRRLVLFAISMIGTLMVISMIAAFMAMQSKNEADRQKEIAIKQTVIAQKQAELAKKREKEAELQRMITETEKLKAEQQTIIAENQKRIAEEQTLEADKQKRLAEIQTQIAINEKKIAQEQRKIAEDQTKIAEFQTKEAQRQAELARLSEAEALKQAEIAKRQRNNALITQSLFLSSQAEKQVEEGKGDIGTLLALEALPKDLENPDRPYVEEAEASLYYSLNSVVNKDAKVTLWGHKNKMIYNLFSPDGKRIVSTSWDKTARLWDAETGKQMGILQGHNHIVEKAKFSKDNSQLVTLADDFSARLWDFKKFKLTSIFKGHSNLLTSADISSDGKRVVTGSIDKTAILWDAATGNKIIEMTNHTNDVVHVIFSPDGTKIVTCSDDSSAIIWDGIKGKFIARLVGHKGNVKAATFSPDGKTIATVSSDKTTRLWDAEKGRYLKTLGGHYAPVNNAEFSNNGKMLISSSQDSTARVYDVLSGDLLAVLKGHTENVYKASFSPDDKRIVTNSDDRSCRLWDANSFLRLAIYKGHPGLNYAASFSPDSRKLAMAGPNFSVNIFQVFPNLQELIDYANKYKKRELTENEKKKFFISDFRIRKEIIDEIKQNENIKNGNNDLRLDSLMKNK